MAVTAKVRAAVQERDGWCRGCGAQGQHVHHIIYRSQGGADTEGNLVWLCEPCHRAAHGTNTRHKIAAWELELVIRAGVSTVSTLRRDPERKLCLGCDYRTVEYKCLVWDQDVAWDYGCDAYKRRGRRLGED